MTSFLEDGYHIERGLLDNIDTENVLFEIHCLFKKYPWQNELLRDMKELLDSNEETYLNTLRLAGQLFSVQELLMYYNISEIKIRELGIQIPAFQTQPVLHVMSEQLKIPGGYFGIGPHQDYSSTEASKNGIIVWIPLTDTENNYPLEVIPGSHKDGLLFGRQKENYYEVADCLSDQFIPLNMKKGDVLFMSVFTVHKTCLEGDFRMAASIRYEDAMDPSFIARGYPCKYKREYQP